MPAHAKRNALLIALGLGAVLAFALVTLPASILAGRLERAGLQALEISGSVWSGSAVGLAWSGALLGDLQWKITPTALLKGRVAGHATLARPDGSLNTDFDIGFAGDARLSATQFELPIEAVSALPIGVPRGWRGRASGRFEEIAVSGGWPTELRGVLDMDGLVAPPPRNAPVGSYHIVLPHPKPVHEGSLPGYLTAKVTDKEGPFSVEAQLAIGRDRSFLFDGNVGTRGDVPEAMRRSLEILGPPDAQGRRPFSVSGTL
jgi:general secretion pathway protein N